MGIPLSEGIALGAVQGVTEFLPISSDGHLALIQLLYGGQTDLAITVLLHVGTLAATVLVLHKRVLAALSEGLRGLARPSLWRETQGGRDAVVVVLATIPTGIVGLALKHSVEEWSSSLPIIGVCLLGSAAAVLSTRWAPKGQRTEPSFWGALLVGLAQGSAVLPGLSRSAMTLATLLWLGVDGERAFELSFLMSLPAITGAVLLEARHAFQGGGDPGVLIIGTTVSFVVGLGALAVLRRVLIKRALPVFALYLVPLAVAVFAWAYARP
jgi:undecaprenyl-diphosphatase